MFNIEEHDNETTGNFVKVDLKQRQRPRNPRPSDINKEDGTADDNEEIFTGNRKINVVKRNSKMGVR